MVVEIKGRTPPDKLRAPMKAEPKRVEAAAEAAEAVQAPSLSDTNPGLEKPTDREISVGQILATPTGQRASQSLDEFLSLDKSKIEITPNNWESFVSAYASAPFQRQLVAFAAKADPADINLHSPGTKFEADVIQAFEIELKRHVLAANKSPTEGSEIATKIIKDNSPSTEGAVKDLVKVLNNLRDSVMYPSS